MKPEDLTLEYASVWCLGRASRSSSRQWKEDIYVNVLISSVQSLSRVRLFVTPWAAAHQAPLSITNSRSLLKLMSIESVMPSNHLILCCPLLLPLSIFPSIRVFSDESVFCIRWPKYWSFSFSISPSNEYPGLISFMMDWLDLLAVQGTLKSLLEHHSSKASILQCSASFFFFLFVFINWRLITLQYCRGFCHTLTWISYGFTCIPNPDPPTHLPLYRIPLGLPSAPGPSNCLMHPTWAGDLFHPR